MIAEKEMKNSRFQRDDAVNTCPYHWQQRPGPCRLKIYDDLIFCERVMISEQKYFDLYSIMCIHRIQLDISIFSLFLLDTFF